MLEHGGRLRQAAADYGIPLAAWLDLSTGINPQPWPVPELPLEIWQRLPEENDGLEAVAATYYGNARLLPVAGSQAAIQCLPTLLSPAEIACLSPLYAEHPHAWQRAGHRLRPVDGGLRRALAAGTPYLLLCNPNNPTAARYRRDAVLDAARQMEKRDGWLIVDEAFIDATPEESVAALAGGEAAPRLLVLRSLGKFFGLAGARVGFALAAPALLAALREALGPWAVSGPARRAAALALADHAWQAAARAQLEPRRRRLRALLAPFGAVRATALFATLRLPNAAGLRDTLARRGILVRHFASHGLLRFGQPGDEAGWARLASALRETGRGDLDPPRAHRGT